MSAESETPAVAGDLRWNVKQSFRDYVGALPDGTEEKSGAVRESEDGDLVFDAVRVDAGDAGDATTFLFEGGVRFRGYRGMLHVDLRDPHVSVTAEGASLSVDTTPPGSFERRIVVATADGGPTRTADGWEWDAAVTRLTAAGAALLGGVYEPASEAAGFSLRVTRR